MLWFKEQAVSAQACMAAHAQQEVQVLFFALGTRGDVQPLAVLANSLKCKEPAWALTLVTHAAHEAGIAAYSVQPGNPGSVICKQNNLSLFAAQVWLAPLLLHHCVGLQTLSSAPTRSPEPRKRQRSFEEGAPSASGRRCGEAASLEECVRVCELFFGLRVQTMVGTSQPLVAPIQSQHNTVAVGFL